MKAENNLIDINIVKRLGKDINLNVDSINKLLFTNGGVGYESN
jgi:hypothetical protein